jgi:hypothetical protein
MTNMVEGNITNQYPLTKIRNYYRMGDGILDGYPIIQDQTSPNLAHIPTTNLNIYSDPTDAQKGSISYASVTFEDNYLWGLGGLINNAIVFGDNSTTRYAYYNSTVTSGTKYALSVFVKMNDNSVPVPLTDFNLALSGSSINSGYNVEVYENNVYRVTASATASASNTANGILKVGSHSTKGFRVTGFQIEEQSQATAYIKSDGIAAVRKSSTTNLITYSEDFSQSYWTKTGSSVTSGFISPDGTATAYSLIEDTSTGVHLVKPPNSSFASNTYTLSVYAKYNGRVLQIASTSTGGHYANFDLLNGVIGNIGGSTANVTMTEISNGWYRCSMTTTSNMNTAIINTVQSATSVYQESYTGNGTSGIYIFGAQVEDQTQVETYAKTTGLPVTIDLFTENNYGTMTNMSPSDIIEDTPNN